MHTNEQKLRTTYHAYAALFYSINDQNNNQVIYRLLEYREKKTIITFS